MGAYTSVITNGEIRRENKTSIEKDTREILADKGIIKIYTSITEPTQIRDKQREKNLVVKKVRVTIIGTRADKRRNKAGV